MIYFSNQGLSPQCRYCTGPNTSLSTGGPDVCVMCEIYGVEPAVWMGMRKPYDFHSRRREAVPGGAPCQSISTKSEP